MSQFISCRILPVVLVISSAVSLFAQVAQSPTRAASQAATATVHGQVADPSGALIPGAAITFATFAGSTAASTTSDASGQFQVKNLAPGAYVISASYPGFASFQSAAITLTANQVKRVDVVMAVAVSEQNVVVTDEASEVNVEAAGNASAVVLKGNDLAALSDDPDELANELSALAGPSAGPNGGQIYIDGFSGGELPPKSAILAIRINQNPFSAEYDRLGYGRTEILTKPGTDKLHGQFYVQGNDNVFNTGNPFTANIPSYYSYQLNGTVGGALTKSSSYFVSVDSRDQQSVNTWLIPDAVLPDSTGQFVDNPNYGVSVLSPHIRDNVSARVDWQMGKITTMTARYGFWYENEKGNLNQGQLSTASTHELNSDHTVQISSSTIFNDHLINESRLQFERHNENHYPDSTARSISIAGDFSGGGYGGQESQDHTISLEFQNITTLSLGNHALKFGTRLRDSRDANLSNSNFNGRFGFSPVTVGGTTYSASQVYENMANGLRAGQTFASLVAAGWGPSSGSYATGNQSVLANVFDVALFAQDDLKVNSRLTVSGGLRWEAQNHIADHDDWAPRAELAYALDGRNGKKTKTVLRVGYGFFYDRFAARNFLTLKHTNGQTQIALNYPTCADATATSLDAVNMATCSSAPGYSANSAAPVQYEIAPHFHAPYTEQLGASLERQLLPGTSVTVTYLHSLGVHQMVTRNANQATGGTPQDSTGNYLYEFFPEAVFKQDQVIANFSTKAGPKLSFSGFYTFSSANSNGAGGGASNAYNLDQDYGRAGFVLRHSMFLMATYNGPLGITFNPFVMAQSGRPFNITLATDPLNNFGNQRPTFATSSTPVADQVSTPYGLLDSAALAGEPLVPINIGNSPAAVAVNLTISRAFGIGPEREGSKASSGDSNRGAGGPPMGAGGPGGGGPGGGGGGGGRYGPGGGGLGPGGLGGGGGGSPFGGGGGGGSTNRKYSLRFSVQALNLFNDIDYGTPGGTLGSPTFNRSTSLAYGAFSSGSAARRIFMQASFSF